jgi:hypothetical protein
MQEKFLRHKQPTPQPEQYNHPFPERACRHQAGVTLQPGGGIPENFVYDNKNRLIEDSTLPNAGQSDYQLYNYIGDSVSFTDGETGSGSFPAGGLNIVNGNIAVNSQVSIVYGSTPNPLEHVLPYFGNLIKMRPIYKFLITPIVLIICYIWDEED